MPVDIQLDGLWAGFCRDGARNGEEVAFIAEEFSSSEDGEAFFSRLEHGPDVILKQLPNALWISRAKIDHLLIVFHPDKRAIVYRDELPLVMTIRSRGKICAGQGVDKDRIADIQALDPGVTIPNDAGLMFLFSVGWRKGFYFDFRPLQGEARQNDLKILFGQFYARGAFQNFFTIFDVEWDKILAEKWFPFIGLSHNMRSEMIAYVRAGWSLDDLTSKVVAEVKMRATEFLEDWERHPTFKDHMTILRRAVERFFAGDFISCAGLLFPRIEGLMRANHMSAGCTSGLGQAHLTTSAIGNMIARESSLLLPRRFHQYLEMVYFASFAPRDLNADLSRNSVGHGVARADSFDEKAAVLAILVIHQLLFFFERAELQATGGAPERAG